MSSTTCTKNNLYALVDCNNFYVSCERVFQPKLINKPVVVLSNNDGCVIARSNEAKGMGIPMGAPYFQWKNFCEKNAVAVYSSNYELYGDMSDRVMSSLKKLCADVEVYSIDEAFLSFNKTLVDTTSYTQMIRQKIKQWTGIPVSIGVSQTKTLAKVANKIAKTKTQEGVFDLSDSELQNKVLNSFPTQDLWGIGHRLCSHLAKLNIHTAKDLRDSDAKWLRSHFSVVVERMVLELRGIACLTLEEIQPKKQIISSRSFGRLISSLTDLEEAISSYAARACLKMRLQQSMCQGIHVFINTNPFRAQDTQYQKGITHFFSEPTDDTRYISHIAKKCLKKIYKPNFNYHKAGIMLLDLFPNSIKQLSFLKSENEKEKRVIETVDKINRLLGKDTVFFCSQGINHDWEIKRNLKSPCYTTRIKEILVAHLR